MLGAIFRGAFLLGVLAWYSTSVWKLIDGYFKEQFHNYLEEEYRKNPRMKSDVEISAAGKVVPAVTTTPPPPPPSVETTLAPLRNIIEACEQQNRAVEAAENDSASNEPLRMDSSTEKETEKGEKEKEKVTGGAGEKEVAGVSIGKNAFLERELEMARSEPTEGKETRRSISQRNLDVDDQRRVDDRSSSMIKNSRRSARKYYKKQASLSKDASEERKTSKKKVKTITLTNEDFATANLNDASDNDFWEFEEDSEEKAPLEGVPVSKLPFKPRVDLGDLERVSADEYCPLTLEDEGSCGETIKWP